MSGSIADYVSYEDMAGDAMRAVEAGLARKREEKRPKKTPLPLEDLDFGPRVKKTKKSVATTVSRGVASSSGEAFATRLRLLSGEATLQDDGIVMGGRASGVRRSGVALPVGATGRRGGGDGQLLLRNLRADGGTGTGGLERTRPRLRRGCGEWRRRQRGQLGLR